MKSYASICQIDIPDIMQKFAETIANMPKRGVHLCPQSLRVRQGDAHRLPVKPSNLGRQAAFLR